MQKKNDLQFGFSRKVHGPRSSSYQLIAFFFNAIYLFVAQDQFCCSTNVGSVWFHWNLFWSDEWWPYLNKIGSVGCSFVSMLRGFYSRLFKHINKKKSSLDFYMFYWKKFKPFFFFFWIRNNFIKGERKPQTKEVTREEGISFNLHQEFKPFQDVKLKHGGKLKWKPISSTNEMTKREESFHPKLKGSWKKKSNYEIWNLKFEIIIIIIFKLKIKRKRKIRRKEKPSSN